MLRDLTCRSLLLMMAVVIAYMIVSLPADAQFTGPCSDTVNKYCKDVTPGGGRIMQCLNDHRDDQSLKCRDWIDAQTKSLNELNTVCAKEIVTFCNFDYPDNIRIYRCLQNNYAGLPADCRDKVREIKERLQ
jgi:hypothetical protein